jgi:CBS domain-containing protein
MANLVHCSPATSIEEAVKLMKENRSTALVVVGDGVAVGMLNDRDVIEHCLTNGKNMKTTRVGDVMERNFHTVNVDYGIASLLDAVRGVGLDRIVVIDEKKRPVGLLGVADLFGLLAEEFSVLAAPPESPEERERAARAA